MNNTTDGFDPEDDEKVISTLKKWKGGVLSDELFTQLAYIIPQPTIETVVLRKKENAIEALLIPRPAHDSIWPGVLHSPGQALRKMDYLRTDNTPLNGPFERVQSLEIKAKFLHTPEFVGIAQYMTKRGPEAVHIFLASIAEDSALPENAIWKRVDDLPQLTNFMDHQIIPINMAKNFFLTKNKN